MNSNIIGKELILNDLFNWRQVLEKMKPLPSLLFIYKKASILEAFFVFYKMWKFIPSQSYPLAFRQRYIHLPYKYRVAN